MVYAISEAAKELGITIEELKINLNSLVRKGYLTREKSDKTESGFIYRKRKKPERQARDYGGPSILDSFLEEHNLGVWELSDETIRKRRKLDLGVWELADEPREADEELKKILKKYSN